MATKKEEKGLTQFEENIVLHYIENGCQSSAYRAVSKSDKMSNKTINEKASRLFARDKVKARVAELRSQVANKTTMDRAWVLEHLKENILVSMGKMSIRRDDDKLVVASHNPSAANTGLKMLGQEIADMFIDVSKQVDDDGNSVVPVINVTIGA